MAGTRGLEFDGGFRVVRHLQLSSCCSARVRLQSISLAVMEQRGGEPASFDIPGKACLWMLSDGDQNQSPTSVIELLCD